MPNAYEELKKEIERRILELVSIKQTGRIEVYKELGELIFIAEENLHINTEAAKRRYCCLLYTSPSPRDGLLSRMPSSA